MQTNVLLFNKITRIRDIDDTRRHKDLIELTRINKRTQSIPPQESFKALVYNPDTKSPAYRDYPIEKCRDFNENDKKIREKEVIFKDAKNERKTVFNLEYDVKKWDKMQKEFEKEVNKINFKKEKFKNFSGVSHGFNIVSLKYEENQLGNNLKKIDLVKNDKLNSRINSLYKKVNSGYDILTGEERKPFVVKL